MTENRKLALDFLKAPFWQSAFDSYFSPVISIAFPNAPAGMPQTMTAFEFRQFRSWARNTIDSWEVEPDIQFWSAMNSDEEFWAIHHAHGKVRWGGTEGEFKSRFVTMLRIENGKIVYIKQLFNPLAFLDAIGKPAPIFPVIYTPEIRQLAAEMEQRPPLPAPNRAVSPEEYKAVCLSVFGVEPPADLSWDSLEFHHETFSSRVYFLPPEMKDNYVGEEKPLIEAWTEYNCKDYDFDPNSVIHQMEDPDVYFIESGFSCMARWGTNTDFHPYRNSYVFRMVFAPDGRQTLQEEYLNPQNKFNSCGISLPTFPYYYR